MYGDGVVPACACLFSGATQVSWASEALDAEHICSSNGCLRAVRDGAASRWAVDLSSILLLLIDAKCST